MTNNTTLKRIDEDTLQKSGFALEKFAALAFWWLVFTVQPLYYENMYFNMIEAKAHIFFAISFFTLLLLAIAYALSLGDSFLPKREYTTLCFYGLGIVSVMSCLLSENMKLTFWGYDGWGIGAFTTMCFAVFLCLLVRRLTYRASLWIPVMLISFIVLFIGVLNYASVDVFGMRERIVAHQYYWYISTIGQHNWFVGYLCLLVPLFAFFYISCRSKQSEILYLIYLAVALLNVILGATDGIYIGLGFCAFFAVPYILADKTRIRRFCNLLIMYGILMLFASLCPWFAKKVADKDGIASKLVDWRLGLAILFVGVVGYLVIRFVQFELTPKLSKILIIIVEVLISCAALYFIIDMIAHFDDSWGSRRGKIWRMSLERYSEFTPLQKLIGVGPGALKYYYNHEDFKVFQGETLRVAHSEPMQFFLCTGIIGLLFWLAGWGSIFYSYFKHKVWENRKIVLFIPLAAYFGQSLVNSPTMTNVATLCAVMACYLKCVHDIKKDNIELPDYLKNFFNQAAQKLKSYAK